MKPYQTIKDTNGNDLFVLVPVAEFEQLTGGNLYDFPYDDETDDDLVEVEYDKDEFDGVTIPFEVVKIKLEQNINNLGAWRIYRNLSQQEVAEKTGISQSAISQAERKGNRPQKRTREKLAKIYGCTPEQLAG
ncbi:helix-turn-helix domain-containing protein [Mannheimia haemolytica]|uniref:helix-turn-helix domain-containing protein n=1 Tax=Mannheimia haemolytica TaxID=75985 RepID=UPI000385855A|nr:helix-turn-helix domain-containing protein [Mannheimia haemolytica]EPZ01153.1 XRE family transcriptional regulator [Mannheimia haemolytica D35]MDW0617944.1 helix-turn-helix domain-containing protein [Mannheimia haemolytica]MDW1149996.1 helix-turn-helix domain-containing protein [Mannheimia haemolytica]MDW1160207.1 helix-turn-helix domain-containing protein [Mannheimia haemolytica]MEE3701585.1 helix-turn-helix domain-containing protein [Mannheimia haemolytica]